VSKICLVPLLYRYVVGDLLTALFANAENVLGACAEANHAI
jgi:hypothetical protein